MPNDDFMWSTATTPMWYNPSGTADSDGTFTSTIKRVDGMIYYKSIIMKAKKPKSPPVDKRNKKQLLLFEWDELYEEK